MERAGSNGSKPESTKMRISVLQNFRSARIRAGQISFFRLSTFPWRAQQVEKPRPQGSWEKINTRPAAPSAANLFFHVGSAWKIMGGRANRAAAGPRKSLEFRNFYATRVGSSHEYAADIVHRLKKINVNHCSRLVSNHPVFLLPRI